MEENVKKVVTAYVVKRYENGDIDVEDAGLEGTETLQSEQIYKDIEDVARVIANKRVENAAYVGAYRFFNDLRAREEAEARAAMEAAQQTDLKAE
jgi:hypothetical protein